MRSAISTVKYLGVAVLLGLLASCGEGRGFSVIHPYSLETNPPPGSLIFQQAYKDGCGSALSGMGSQFIKVFHEFKYDASLAQDKLYNRVWESSNNYCRLFLFVGDQQFMDEDFKQQDKPFWFWK